MITITSQAAVALWKCILRFMGDLPEPKHYAVEKDNTPMMSKVSATLGRNFSKSKQFQELGQLQENGDGSGEAVDKKLVSLTLKRQDKMGENIKQRLMDEDGAEASYSDWLDARPTTNMEKLHFITGATALLSQSNLSLTSLPYFRVKLSYVCLMFACLSLPDPFLSALNLHICRPRNIAS